MFIFFACPAANEPKEKTLFLRYFFALSEKSQDFFHSFSSPKTYVLSSPRLRKLLTKNPCYTEEKEG